MSFFEYWNLISPWFCSMGRDSRVIKPDSITCCSLIMKTLYLQCLMSMNYRDIIYHLV